MTKTAPGVAPAPLRLGLVGAGPWGRSIITTIDRLDGLSLTHLVTTRAENRDLAGDDCRVVGDAGDILSPDLLDGLVVAIPPQAQPEIVLAALAAGVPVFAEKPLALDAATAERLAGAARAAGVPLVVDHIHLFSPGFRGLLAALGELGPIRHISSEAGRWGPFREGVSVLWDFGPHDVSMCLKAMGRPPDTVSAIRHPAAGEGETVELRLAFDHVVAHCVLSNRRDKPARRFHVEGADGELLYDDKADAKLQHRFGDDAAWRPVGVPADLALDTALLEFAGAVNGGVLDTNGLDLAVEVVRVLAGCEQSLAS